MVAQARLYIEGDRRLTRGFRRFLRDADDVLGKREIRLRVILCGNRENTIDRFQRALRDYPQAAVFLLVDSDEPVTVNTFAREQRRVQGRRKRPVAVERNQLHYMVQVMESWFLADQEALREYYGQDLLIRRLPANPQVESIAKREVRRGLRAATRGTTKGEYHKTQHAPHLLARLDPERIRLAAPHCNRLFRALADVGG